MVKKEQSTFVQHHQAPAPISVAPHPAPPKEVSRPVEVPPVVEMPKPVEVPPKFTRPVSAAVVTEGEKLLLEAQFDGMEETFACNYYIKH